MLDLSRVGVYDLGRRTLECAESARDLGLDETAVTGIREAWLAYRANPRYSTFIALARSVKSMKAASESEPVVASIRMPGQQGEVAALAGAPPDWVLRRGPAQRRIGDPDRGRPPGPVNDPWLEPEGLTEWNRFTARKSPKWRPSTAMDRMLCWR